MRKIAYSLLAIIAFATVAACSNEETYGDKKEKERNAISQFIADSAITVIDEEQFLKDTTTNVENNEFVYLSKSGVYMQIVRRGTGSMLEENKNVSLLCRFYEYDILDKTVTLRNDIATYAHYYDKMTVYRTGGTYTGYFVSGLMYTAYGSSSSSSTVAVPSGWLVPLQYIKLGRKQDEVAKVKIIVPHTQGHSTASAYVTPYYYIITFQREK